MPEKILGMYHGDSLSAHQGANAMIHAMHTHVYWRGMNAAIHRYVVTCITCQSCKPPQDKCQGLLHPFNFFTTAPMEDIAVDHYGPLPETPASHKHVFVMVDMFTHWIEAIPVPDTTAVTTARQSLTIGFAAGDSSAVTTLTMGQLLTIRSQ